ncbi:FAD-binding oxidoreductase [Neolewinella lacunae]|uniref:Oxidoreductase n=1 Tax=Neolewinella lacunae TaxID=1517758 RepID=A0A923PHG7_9BACT|nr:FAD-binding oxidoreductase [Neolewinella lacunae]MBC6992690.1 oxidoreductase [Neolewinella lacunae]MDN3633570.1 FAD-binding oxidoreductase [Neolewinella lacunae]
MKWKPAIIRRIEQRTPTVRSFWLEMPDRASLDFRPGQFLTLELPVSERRRDGWRSYSIAAAPDGSNQAELCIVRLPDGKGTSYLFEGADVGTELLAKEPGGVFTLPEGPLTKNVVMICTGTGVAPFRAMLQERLGRESVHFHLIFGCRTAEDILYREEFAALARQYANFTYSVALSRSDVLAEDGIDFHRGYVHPVYERDYAAVRPDVCFYLCGWSEMVDEAKRRLLALGYAPEQVIAELYG